MSGPPVPTDAGSAPNARPVPRWAWHRRLYDWVLSWAHRPGGTAALFCLSFAESSFFPIPPDVLQIALTLERRSRAFFYAGVSTIASVLGGVVGYAIGWGLWHAVSGWFIPHLFTQDQFDRVAGMYQDNAFLAVFTAALTPIPYKVFTIAAGVSEVSLVTLVVASILGRGGRFFAVAALLWWLGPSMKRFIDRWFDLLTVAFTILLVGGFVLFKYLR